LSIRGRSSRFEGEVTFFRNAISNFVFRNPLTEEEFHDREEEFHERFGVEEEEEGEEDDHGDFPFVEFLGRDSVLMGVEAHADLKLTDFLIAETTFDWVKGELADTNEPLPRIPPFRVLAGLRFQRSGFQVGGSVTAVSDQTRVYGDETPTDGYTTGRLFGSYSFTRGGVLNTITARLENVGDTLYRNHLNYLKDELPEIGRSFRIVYSVGF
jgi:iron complex outermembrane receptor protein